MVTQKEEKAKAASTLIGKYLQENPIYTIDDSKMIGKLAKAWDDSEVVAWELYDLSADISEEKDLSKANPAKFEEMMAAWTKLNAEMVEPFWSPARR